MKHPVYLAKSARAVEYTDSFSAEEEDSSPISVLDMHKTIDGGVPVMLEHCHCSQVHSGSEWYDLIGFYLCVK